MNPQHLLDQILNSLETVLQSGEEIPDELASELAQTINGLVQEIGRGRVDERGVALPPGNPPSGGSGNSFSSNPNGLQLLWILAGGDQAAFVNYLRTMPVPQGNALLQDPTRLQETINALQEMLPEGFLQTQSQGGIPHGPLQSSNIYGFQYNDKTGELMVRFNSGSTYKYDGVPPSIFKVFEKGMVPAKTDGSNEFGRWWVGKSPSAGASFYEMIRDRFPYERVA